MNSIKTVAVFGAFDTKGAEFAYLAEQLKAYGVRPLMVDTGTRFDPPFRPEYPASEVAKASGHDLEQLRASQDMRADCLVYMAEGARNIIVRLCEAGEIQGAISLGGGQGTFMASIVFQALPIGFPKVLLSTSVTHKEMDMTNDTMVMCSLVDIAGLNPILCMTIKKVAIAMAGMLHHDCAIDVSNAKKRVGISMWGLTTPCANRIMERLDAAGMEHYAFHVHPQGEAIMLKLVDQGFFDGMIDLTLPGDSAFREYAKGEDSVRLLHAARAGIPQICSFGGIDLIGVETFADPKKDLKGRALYEHTKEIVFARSSREENAAYGAFFAKQLNQSAAPVICLFPMKGTSFASREGGPVYAPDHDRAFVAAFQANAKPEIRTMTMDCNINDMAFADKVADLMIAQLS